MRVIILGAGVIGTTSAYYLARAGHEVTVIDRQAEPAAETSFANAGQISVGYAAPWAAPGVPLKAIKWLLQKHGPLAIKPDGSATQLRWILAMLGQCNAHSYSINKARMLRLASYSQTCLQALRDSTHLHYEGRQGGTLQIFRTQQQLDNSTRDIAVLRDQGLAYRRLQANELAQVEPALLGVQEKLSGGLYLPNDETGDCHLFTTQLAQLAQEIGVHFRYQTTVERVDIQGGEAQAVHIQHANGKERLTAEAMIVALASFSPSLLQDWVRLPVYPVKGYSITTAIANDAAAPISTVLDETYKIAITRFDHRIRVGGMAHIMGFDNSLQAAKRATLRFVLDDLFPSSAPAQEELSFWAGLRPMTPDGTPIVGASGIKGLWLNTGHGTLGWTMACGSAALLTDLINKKTPAIAADDLSLARYR